MNLSFSFFTSLPLVLICTTGCVRFLVKRTLDPPPRNKGLVSLVYLRNSLSLKSLLFSTTMCVLVIQSTLKVLSSFSELLWLIFILQSIYELLLNTKL